MSDTTLRRRTFAKGTAWAVPTVLIAANAPAHAASVYVCPTSKATNTGCSWNAIAQGNTQINEQAYTNLTNNTDTWTYNLSYAAIMGTSMTKGTKMVYTFDFIYPSTATPPAKPGIGGLGIGGAGTGADWSPSWAVSTPVAAAKPANFAAGNPTAISWLKVTYTLTLTLTSNYDITNISDAQICAGINFNWTGFTDNINTGSQMQATVGMSIQGHTCSPAVYATPSGGSYYIPMGQGPNVPLGGTAYNYTHLLGGGNVAWGTSQ
ncbi:MAG TPA: hypothetical protein PKC73_02935 [Dermatophilaceae bacterium]|nr:hypothetical protein [Dermatophilaceae bacterium]